MLSPPGGAELLGEAVFGRLFRLAVFRRLATARIAHLLTRQIAQRLHVAFHFDERSEISRLRHEHLIGWHDVASCQGTK